MPYLVNSNKIDLMPQLFLSEILGNLDHFRHSVFILYQSVIVRGVSKDKAELFAENIVNVLI